MCLKLHNEFSRFLIYDEIYLYFFSLCFSAHRIVIIE